MNHSFIYIAAAALCCILIFCRCAGRGKGSDFTSAESELIGNGSADSTMRVLTISSDDDEKILRAKSTFLSREALMSDGYSLLCQRMIATVTDPSQDGVGIAGPQVGVNRRVVAVQRFDKEGEPFEVYANIRIIKTYGEKEAGSEGCLSVPDRSEEVERYQKIDIEYDRLDGSVKRVKETIEGFTAVIFQHECDHLDGVLYIDRI